MNYRDVSYVNLAAQALEDLPKLMPAIEEVLLSGNYILGDAVEFLERQAADFCGVEHCVAVNSGTDALMFALVASGVRPGDEVITPPNSFVASTSTIVHLGAVPVFVDVLEDQLMDPNEVKKALTKRTKAIMPVHLSGRMCKMNELEQISIDSGVPLVEDAAQAFGSEYMNRRSGSWGEVGCFSVHPLKNFAAVGDGGFITTRNSALASEVRIMRNHGMKNRNMVERFGVVSRMDEIQAAILNVRMSGITTIIKKRRQNADFYFRELGGLGIELPTEKEFEFNSYHTFVIQVDQRDQLQEFLLMRGVGTAIHYPTLIHHQPAAKVLDWSSSRLPIAERQASRILSIPIHQHLSADDLEHVAHSIRCFYENSN